MRAVPYELRTDLLGVVVRHSGDCRARDGLACSCGPLGFRAGVWDWDAGRWIFSPLVSTVEAARQWQWAANRAGGVGMEDGAGPREQFAWWAFCYVALGFFALAVGLGTAALAA
jgi:hypothetical protein